MKMNKKVLLVAITALTAVSTAALAGAGGAEFTTIADNLGGWLSGAPGKAIAVLAFGAAMFNVVKQNFIAAGGSFVGCLLMANAEGIIESFMTAGI